MKKICGIYYIKNNINNKYYIGQSSDIYKRWKQHINNLNNNTHVNQYLQNAWNKYGAVVFDFKIIKACKSQYLNRFEKLYVNIYQAYTNGYNMTLGGNIQPTDMPEICKKISDSMIGDKNHFYGKNHSLISEIKMSKRQNTTGYFRVSKESGNYKQGFRWRYQYFDKNGCKRAIKSVDIDKLREKVISKGLLWIEY